MVTSRPPPTEIVQNCYVVRNLEMACAHFHARFGIGPFVGGAEIALDGHVYRGRTAAPIRLRGVFVQSGALNIELVEMLSDGPCAFRDMFVGEEEGFHHVAIFCADYAAECAAWKAAGYELASEFTFGSEKICYIDARRDMGHMIELYPENPTIRAMYAQARDAPRRWDGRNLVVPWEA